MLSLYFHFVSISFRSQMQYKASFFMSALAHFISTFVDIFAIWILFERFKIVRDWSFYELMPIYGIIHIGFAIAEAFARGFDTFDLIVKYGDFDRYLLRPLNTLFQIAASEVQLLRIGRFTQGLIILCIGCSKLNFHFLSLNTLVIILAVIGTASLFFGLFILQATFSFWTIESLELMNITTYGGVEAGQYPMNLYNKGFRLFFTFIIPLACVAYYPIAAILQKENIAFIAGVTAPIAGIFFLFICCLIWNLGVRHYNSVGC